MSFTFGRMVPLEGADEPTPSRTARGRRTADRFVEAAMERLAERGFEGLTIGGLAKDLGYAVGTLYRHFPSKGALVVAMQARVVEGVRRDLLGLDERLAGVPGPGVRPRSLAPLVATHRVYIDLACHAPERFALLSITLGDPRELVDPAEARALVPNVGALLADVASRFERAAEAGALGPGDATRRALSSWASLHGVLQLRKLERFGVPGLDTRTLALELGHSLLTAWGATPEDLQSAEGLMARADAGSHPVRLEKDLQ
jgi:AcrR family transcriptional regulator